MPSAKEKPKQKVNFQTYFIHYAYCLAIIALLSLTSVNINKYLENQKVLSATIDVTPLQNEKLYWQTLISQNPSYIDAYLQLAKVEVELGNKNEASDLIAKALQLDPNSPKITSAQKALGL